MEHQMKEEKELLKMKVKRCLTRKMKRQYYCRCRNDGPGALTGQRTGRREENTERFQFSKERRRDDLDQEHSRGEPP